MDRNAKLLLLDPTSIAAIAAEESVATEFQRLIADTSLEKETITESLKYQNCMTDEMLDSRASL